MLPNSIQRTAPIVGYDPYAFIMGKTSNYTQGLRQGGGLDYYAKKPENMYTSGEKAKKGFSITPHLKGILTVAAVLTGAAALFLEKDKAKAANAVSSTASNAGSAAAGAAGNGGGKISTTLISAKDFVVDHLASAGRFISGKFHDAGAFIKGKIHKP